MLLHVKAPSDFNIIIVADFIISFSIITRSSRQRGCQRNIKVMHITDTSKLFYPTIWSTYHSQKSIDLSPKSTIFRIESKSIKF